MLFLIPQGRLLGLCPSQSELRCWLWACYQVAVVAWVRRPQTVSENWHTAWQSPVPCLSGFSLWSRTSWKSLEQLILMLPLLEAFSIWAFPVLMWSIIFWNMRVVKAYCTFSCDLPWQQVEWVVQGGQSCLWLALLAQASSSFSRHSPVTAFFSSWKQPAKFWCKTICHFDSDRNEPFGTVHEKNVSLLSGWTAYYP